MDTYTIAEAARLVGTSTGKLSQAMRAGRLQALAGQEPGAVLRVTPEALRAAGFALPPAPRPASPPAPAPPEAAAPEGPALPPERPGPDQALLAHLERALEQARERELRLLDLLADLTRQRRAPQTPLAAPVLPAASPRPLARPPLSGLRQQIVEVVRQHPEGIAPRDVQTLLAVDHDVRSTMKGMVRSGILTRRTAGRYVVAPEGAGPQGGHRGAWRTATRRRFDALPLAAVVAPIAALEAGELLALVRHVRPRLVPGEAPPAAAVVERIVQMGAAELRELGRRLRERRAPASAEG